MEKLRPRAQRANSSKAAAWGCTLARFQALGICYYYHMYILQVQMLGSKSREPHQKGRQGWCHVICRTCWGPVRYRDERNVAFGFFHIWVFLPTRGSGAAGAGMPGHRWALSSQRRSFTTPDGSTSPATLAAPSPDILRVTSTMTCTALFSPGWAAAPSARMARGAGEGPGPWGSL